MRVSSFLKFRSIRYEDLDADFVQAGINSIVPARNPLQTVSSDSTWDLSDLPSRVNLLETAVEEKDAANDVLSLVSPAPSVVELETTINAGDAIEDKDIKTLRVQV